MEARIEEISLEADVFVEAKLALLSRLHLIKK
jgi:hypothetical protein